MVAKTNVNAKKRFFNDKRTQSIGIAIAKIPPINKVEIALTKMDATMLTRSQISALYKEYITEDEFAEYEALNEPGMVWEKQEEFMVGLHKIPFAKLKLGIWSFTFDYEENYEGVTSTISYVKLANDEIKNNEILKKLLCYVLTIGNILNGGTPKGQADGFSLDALSKLGSIKDTSNKTLTSYICGLIKKEDENFDNVKKNFPNLSEAGKISMAETQSSLNKLKKELRDQKANLEKISSLGDEFVKKATKTFDNFSSQVETAEKNFQDAIKHFQETALYYGYTANDSKYKNPEEFFNLINDFLNEVDRSIPKSEPKKVFNRKHEVGKKLVDNTNNMDNLLKELKSRSNNN